MVAEIVSPRLTEAARIVREKPMKVAKYTGEKKESNIKRHFTYPNLSPYELEISTTFQKNVRHVVRDVASKGIYFNYFEELEACYFEDELAYMMLKKMVDIDMKSINLNKFTKFNINDYKQAVHIVAIALSITNDAISR